MKPIKKENKPWIARYLLVRGILGILCQPLYLCTSCRIYAENKHRTSSFAGENSGQIEISWERSRSVLTFHESILLTFKQWGFSIACKSTFYNILPFKKLEEEEIDFSPPASFADFYITGVGDSQISPATLQPIGKAARVQHSRRASTRYSFNTSGEYSPHTPTGHTTITGSPL